MKTEMKIQKMAMTIQLVYDAQARHYDGETSVQEWARIDESNASRDIYALIEFLYSCADSSFSVKIEPMV